MVGATYESVTEPFRRPVQRWLATVCLLLLAMVVVGGITRVTGSGLSIVEWKPVTGAVPPLTDDDWRRAFEAYQGSPQYRLVNAGMSLAAFKAIFFWEYVHRLLGRVLGLVFFVPWAFFVARGALSRALSLRLFVGLVLVGLQGALGWLMVSSGLVDVPHVSHYRLAAHLGLALLVLGYLFWIWLELRGKSPGAGEHRVAFAITLALVAVQIVWGGFTAGLHAGLGYNTFPTMHGEWMPAAAFAFEPGWRNVVDNPAAVQLVHRALGTLVVVMVATLLSISGRMPARLRRATRWLAGCVTVQFSLGVATLLFVVPPVLAVVHQLGAFTLFLSTLRANHEARRA